MCGISPTVILMMFTNKINTNAGAQHLTERNGNTLQCSTRSQLAEKTTGNGLSTHMRCQRLDLDTFLLLCSHQLTIQISISPGLILNAKH